MARCPDCNKFASLENAADTEDSSTEYSTGTVTVRASVNGHRNCADCGTELKSLYIEMEEDFELEQMADWSTLSGSEQKAVLEALEDGSVEPEIDADDPEVDESGGSRYKKNIIATSVGYTVTIEHKVGEKDIKLTHQGTLRNEAAASEYEECC